MTDGASDGRPRVLLVEDERTLGNLYASWLSGRYDVETAYDGEDALAAYDGTVDVVLLDRVRPHRPVWRATDVRPGGVGRGLEPVGDG